MAGRPKKEQTRRSLSMSGEVYGRANERCKNAGVSLAGWVEGLVKAALDRGDVAPAAVRGRKSKPAEPKAGIDTGEHVRPQVDPDHDWGAE
jgi:hypothetical protein